MEQNQNLSEQRKEFYEKRKELSQLKNQLHSLHTEKETIFQELKNIHSQIRGRNDRVKKLREERDQQTSQVKSLKEERDKLNQAVKEKAGERKEVEHKKEELLHKLDDIKEDPRRIKAQITALEKKIETEVMPFDKEQQLTKRIKGLKVIYKKMEELGTVWKEINSASADFSETRKLANEHHHNIQQLAQEFSLIRSVTIGFYDEYLFFRKLFQ